MRLSGPAAGLASLVLAVSCATAPPAAPPPGPGPEPLPEGVRTELLGVSSPGPGVPAASAGAFLLPGPLDLERWPFGWVVDSEGARLGLAGRFWSDQKSRWTEVLDPRTPASRKARLLKQIAAGPDSEEAARAAWRLWRVYSQAGLGDEARTWLDRAALGVPEAELPALDRAWDQLFRLGDPAGSRGLWPAGGFPALAGDDARKARLLRQKLFLGTLSLGSSGADDYVSSLVLDQDDLWAGTWNGALVRWSLTTGTLDRLLTPDTVSPVTRLAATAWFVYAFQDQSLLRYSKVTGTWRTFPYPPGWSGLRVCGVVSEGEESLLVAHLGQGLWRWEAGRWTLVDGEGGGPFLTALASDGRGGLWIGTKDRGLWAWRDGLWTPVSGPGDHRPADISVLAPDPAGGRWAVGTWGEGTWLLDGGTLVPESGGREYVTAAAWSAGRPVWGTVDEGLVTGQGAGRQILGPLDGLPAGGVSSLAVWQDRWIWGTTGQGLGWWSENENPALLR